MANVNHSFHAFCPLNTIALKPRHMIMMFYWSLCFVYIIDEITISNEHLFYIQEKHNNLVIHQIIDFLLYQKFDLRHTIWALSWSYNCSNSCHAQSIKQKKEHVYNLVVSWARCSI